MKHQISDIRTETARSKEQAPEARATKSAKNQRDADRMECFSDGIIGIAATLLAVDLKVPRIGTIDGTTLLQALAEHWHSYFAFTVTFIFIGISWAAHHDMFTYIRRTNHMLLILNLFFLMGIALQPFSTALLSEHLGTKGERAAALVYYTILLLTSLAYNLVWFYAVRRELFEPGISPRVLRALTREHAVAPILHAAALLIAIWSVRFSFIPLVALYVFFAIPRITERAPHKVLAD